MFIFKVIIDGNHYCKGTVIAKNNAEAMKSFLPWGAKSMSWFKENGYSVSTKVIKRLS